MKISVPPFLRQCMHAASVHMTKISRCKTVSNSSRGRTEKTILRCGVYPEERTLQTCTGRQSQRAPGDPPLANRMSQLAGEPVSRAKKACRSSSVRKRRLASNLALDETTLHSMCISYYRTWVMACEIMYIERVGTQISPER